MKKIRPRFLLICFVIALMSVSCADNQSNIPTELPQYHSLIDVLAVPSDFSGNWEWIFLYNDKDALTPAPDNNLSSDFAASSLIGRLLRDKEKYAFTFFHSVRMYDPSNQNSPSPFTEHGFPEPFPILLVEMGDSMEIRCSRTSSAKPDPIFLCEIMVEYRTLKSFLRITGDVNAGEQTTENIINQLLTAVDGRIEAYQP